MTQTDTADGKSPEPQTPESILPEPGLPRPDVALPETSQPESPETAAPEPDTTVPPQPAAKRGGFAGGVLGGVIAAAAGFGVAQYVPNGWPLADTSALAVQLAEQAAQIKTLSEQPTAETTLSARLAALEGQPAPDVSALESRLALLEERLAVLEARPAEGGSAATQAAQDAALQALQAEVQALKTAATPAEVQALTAKAEAQLQEAEAAAAQVKADAEALAKTTALQAALGQLQAALDSGAPYADVMPAFPDLPAVLSGAAETGLPTLATLQDSFAPAARAALDAALRANMGASWAERATSFLRTQTGARSLEPRDGNDPDAILSRAEAALAAGDLVLALSELTALPAESQLALAEWRTAAETRLAAAQAVADLAATIGK